MEELLLQNLVFQMEHVPFHRRLRLERARTAHAQSSSSRFQRLYEASHGGSVRSPNATTSWWFLAFVGYGFHSDKVVEGCSSPATSVD